MAGAPCHSSRAAGSGPEGEEILQEMNDRAPASTRELLDFATEIAWEAGRLIMRHFQVGVGVTTKPDRTPVTEADVAGERLLRKRIEARFPGHRILGEEDGESGSDPTHRWILDPIDGTTSFIHGVPLFGMLIGLEIADEAVVGVCNIAGLGEMVTGARGEGAFWNGRPARVSNVTEIGNALATTTDPATIGPIWEAVGAKGAVRRTWGDAFGHALVCTGRSEIGLDPEMKPWDSSPFLPILEEAGGRFTDWDGNRTIHGPNALSTNGALHDEVLELLAEVRGR